MTRHNMYHLDKKSKEAYELKNINHLPCNVRWKYRSGYFTCLVERIYTDSEIREMDGIAIYKLGDDESLAKEGGE